MDVVVRPVRPSDAEAIVGVLNPIISSGGHTVLDRTLSAEDERRYLERFSPRGVFHVAERADGGAVVGLQSLEPFASYTSVFDHVAVIGTFVDLSLRRQGVGTLLSRATFEAARRKGFEKLFTYILASNAASLAFHKSLGFRVIGTARRQAKFGDRYEDEVLVERFIDGAGAPRSAGGGV